VITLEPACSVIALAVQLVVPAAVPPPPRLLVHVTWVTPMLSEAVPVSVRGEAVTARGAAAASGAIVTDGGVVSLTTAFNVTVKVAVLELPAASLAVTVITFAPA
jgi:hypothetical protein